MQDMLLSNEPMVKTTLQNRLQIALDSSGKSQRKIALAIGITPQALNKWLKTGNASKENLKDFSDETGCDYLWLLTGEERPTNQTGFISDDEALKMARELDELLSDEQKEEVALMLLRSSKPKNKP